MPYDSKTYRVLIASPSDVIEEREIAVRVIQEWNDLHSYAKWVVLLPLRWETHTAPEYGTRPQEVINRAIVDECDLLVGVFWTRIGTSTGVADGGTLEEIARAAEAGKPVMIYFSNVAIQPDSLDSNQYERLREFKAKISPQALTESYRSHIEFRDKLAKQIELKVRDLQASEGLRQRPPLSLTFTVRDSGPPSGETEFTVELPTVPDLEDQVSTDSAEVAQRIREAVEVRSREATSVPIAFQISNTGASGIRNLFVEMLISASSATVEVADYNASLLSSLESLPFWSSSSFRNSLRPSSAEDGSLREVAQGWKFSFEWDALQPQRIRAVSPILLIKSGQSAQIAFKAKIFADSFAAPVDLEASIRLIVNQRNVDIAELVPDLSEIRNGTENKKLKAKLARSLKDLDAAFVAAKF